MSKETDLIELIEADLPIKVNSRRELLGKANENWPDMNITLSTVFEIKSVVDMLDQGGVVCGIVPEGEETEDQATAFLCSITHLKIIKGQKHYGAINKYQIKRTKKLKKQNQGKRW